MYERMIIDADICIKLGCSKKYQFLKEVLPLIAKEIYMHSHAHDEILIPNQQLEHLIQAKIVRIVNENNMTPQECALYDMTYGHLSDVMIDPHRPNKNKGETCSLAYAKVKGIPIFATDERDLQPIIDSRLNTGMDDIRCLRIADIVEMARVGKIDLPRKKAKALWAIAGKNTTDFDKNVWPLE